MSLFKQHANMQILSNVSPILVCICLKSIRENDALVQERRNSIALAMELRLSCTNPSKESYLSWK